MGSSGRALGAVAAVTVMVFGATGMGQGTRFVATDLAPTAERQLDRYVKGAHDYGMRVLAVFVRSSGCPACDELVELLQFAEPLRDVLDPNYIYIPFDADRPDVRAMASRLGIGLERDHLPKVAIIDGSGAVLRQHAAEALQVGRHADVGKIRAILEAWVVSLGDARMVFREATTKARGEHKRVLAVLGAPWCAGCHVLDKLLDRPEIAALVARDYVVARIDIARMQSGQEIAARLGHAGGVPWLAVVDGDGRVLASSGRTQEDWAGPYDVIARGAVNLTALDLARLSRDLGPLGKTEASPR